MELGAILSFLGASFILTVMPGPDNIFVLTESLTKGQRNGIAISLGLGSGVLVHTLAAATGLSIIIQQSAIAFSVIKYVGAAYLLYLAYMSMKEKKIPVEVISTNNDTKERGFLYLIRKGLLMNVLNPKVSLFFIAFLPQLITKGGFNMTTQMIILGLIFMVQAIVIFSLVAILSGKLTVYVNNPKFWQTTKWSKVGVLTLLGVSLALAEQ